MSLDTVKISVGGKDFYTKKGTTLEEIAKEFEKEFKHPILIAKANNTLKELNYKVEKPKSITFLDLNSKEGNRIHINTLMYILSVAVKELYGVKYDVCSRHSIDKGLYVGTNFVLTERNY